MTLPPSASTATSSFLPVHAAVCAVAASVSRPSCSASTMLRPRSRTPPTRRSQSSRDSSVLPAASVPRNPTRKSEPSSRSIVASRALSGASAAPQPAASKTPRRLAAASRRNELLHACALDRKANVAAALDRGADDQRVGHRQELRRGLGGDPAADEDRDVRAGTPHALDVGERRHLTG